MTGTTLPGAGMIGVWLSSDPLPCTTPVPNSAARPASSALRLLAPTLPSRCNRAFARRLGPLCLQRPPDQHTPTARQSVSHRWQQGSTINSSALAFKRQMWGNYRLLQKRGEKARQWQRYIEHCARNTLVHGYCAPDSNRYDPILESDDCGVLASGQPLIQSVLSPTRSLKRRDSRLRLNGHSALRRVHLNVRDWLPDLTSL